MLVLLMQLYFLAPLNTHHAMNYKTSEMKSVDLIIMSHWHC